MQFADIEQNGGVAGGQFSGQILDADLWGTVNVGHGLVLAACGGRQMNGSLTVIQGGNINVRDGVDIPDLGEILREQPLDAQLHGKQADGAIDARPHHLRWATPFCPPAALPHRPHPYRDWDDSRPKHLGYWLKIPCYSHQPSVCSQSSTVTTYPTLALPEIGREPILG